MTKSTLLFLLTGLFFHSAFAQAYWVLGGIKAEPGIKLVGISLASTQQSSTDQFNFLIENPASIDSLSKVLKLGKQIPTNILIGEEEIQVYVLKQGDILHHWTIIPAQSAIRIQGITFDFKLKYLRQIAKKFHFNYSSYTQTFKTKDDLDQYYRETRIQEDFLFARAPNLKYEGQFNIQVQKSEQYSNPRQALAQLNPILKTLSGSQKFRSVYPLNTENLENQDQFTFSISAVHEVYQAFEHPDFTKKGWKAFPLKATFFLIEKD